jgi:hypothetical protein
MRTASPYIDGSYQAGNHPEQTVQSSRSVLLLQIFADSKVISRGGWPRIDPVFRRRGKRPRARTPGPERPLPACVSLRRLSLRNPSAVFPDRSHGKAVLSGPPASPSLTGCFWGLFLAGRNRPPANLVCLNAVGPITQLTQTSGPFEVFEKQRVIGINSTEGRPRIRLVFRQTSSFQRQSPRDTTDRNRSVPGSTGSPGNDRFRSLAPLGEGTRYMSGPSVFEAGVF